MKSFMKRCFVSAALVLSIAGAWAQQSPAAVVEFSSGDDIVVIREGKRVAIQDPIGLQLYQGDQVQTGKGVFVELRLAGGGAVIKLAENTTFVLERLSDGQTSLQLVYGRIRAKVEKLAGTDSFSVRSTQAVAGVRGTDFGLDVVASRSITAATTTSAYCFEGSVEVTAFVRSDVLAAESLEAIPKAFVLAAGEMVQVEGVTGKAEATKTVIDEAIKSFWTVNDYVVEPSVLAPVKQPETAPDVAALPVIDEKAIFDRGYAQGYDEARKLYERAPDYVPDGFVRAEELEAVRRASRWQKGSVLAGSLAGLGGAGLAVWGFMMIEAGDTAGGTAMLEYGAIASALSLPFLAVSLFIRP